jgi:hypothetical protein
MNCQLWWLSAENLGSASKPKEGIAWIVLNFVIVGIRNGTDRR